MKRAALFLVLLAISGCSSFGIRTSTQIPTIVVDEGTVHIHVHINGNIPGAGVDSNVPVERPVIRTTIGQERTPTP